MVQIGIKQRGRKSENQMIVVALWGMAADFNHVEDKCQRRLFCNFIKAADKDHVSHADFTMVNMNFLTQYQAAFPVRNASQKTDPHLQRVTSTLGINKLSYRI